MRTPGSALGCSWGRAIRLTPTLTRTHMLTRTPVITMIPTIIHTHTATIHTDIGAVDIIGVDTAADTIGAADIGVDMAAAIAAAAVVTAAVAVVTAVVAVVALAVAAVTAADGAGKQSAKVVD